MAHVLALKHVMVLIQSHLSHYVCIVKGSIGINRWGNVRIVLLPVGVPAMPKESV